jgi:hypothetical protein
VGIDSGTIERLTALDGANEMRAIAAADGITLWFNREMDDRVSIHRMDIGSGEQAQRR